MIIATMEPMPSGLTYRVFAGRREIGAIVLFRNTWRFLHKKGDPRFPVVGVEHATPDAALNYVNRTLA